MVKFQLPCKKLTNILTKVVIPKKMTAKIQKLAKYMCVVRVCHNAGVAL